MEFEPTNRYDSNAIKVLVVKSYENGKGTYQFVTKHVAYIQRHAAAKIVENLAGKGNFPKYLVGTLRGVQTYKQHQVFEDYEIMIDGAINNLNAFFQSREKVKNDVGIFGQPKIPTTREDEFNMSDRMNQQDEWL